MRAWTRAMTIAAEANLAAVGVSRARGLRVKMKGTRRKAVWHSHPLLVYCTTADMPSGADDTIIPFLWSSLRIGAHGSRAT